MLATTRTLPLLLVALALPPAQPARAQDDPQPPPAPAAPASDELAQIIDDLDAEDLQARLKADERLRDDPALRLTDLERALRSTTITPEQRRRLMGAARERFNREPRAALGITFDPLAARGVTVRDVRPEFPAAGLLIPGDRIESIDGVRMEPPETLRAVVVARDPGDVVTAQVLRNGELKTVRVPLGSYAGPAFLAPITEFLPAAWRQRSRAYATADAGAEPPIASRLPGVAWRRGENVDVVAGPEAVLDVSAGGEPDENGSFALGGDEPVRLGVANGRLAELQRAQLELGIAIQTLGNLQSQAQMYRQRLLRKDLSPQERESAQRLLDRVEAMIQRQSAEIQGLLNRQRKLDVIPDVAPMPVLPR